MLSPRQEEQPPAVLGHTEMGGKQVVHLGVIVPVQAAKDAAFEADSVDPPETRNVLQDDVAGAELLRQARNVLE